MSATPIQDKQIDLARAKVFSPRNTNRSTANPVHSADWFTLYGTPSKAKIKRLRMANIQRMPAFMINHRRSIQMFGRAARWRPKTRDRPTANQKH